jgi:ATP-dependent DNA ligase
MRPLPACRVKPRNVRLLRYKVDRSQEKHTHLASLSARVPSHPDRIHEVKQDGFRLIVARDGDRVRLYTNGYDWTSRYPLIVEAVVIAAIEQARPEIGSR